MKLQKPDVIRLLAEANDKFRDGNGFVSVVWLEGGTDGEGKPVPVDPNLDVWREMARRGWVLRDACGHTRFSFSITSAGMEKYHELCPDAE